jgi:NAD(P)-dependent dehydrogenase (short-subunit alcohol dehydrogenase family)
MNPIPTPTPIDRVLSLQGKCAVVTGGNRGLGEAIVKRLAEAGALVLLTGRGEEALRRVESELTTAGKTAVAVQADASRAEDWHKVIDLAVERFGGVDILVNNAAIFPPRLSLEVNEKVWDETLAIDLKGAFFTAQLAAKERMKSGGFAQMLAQMLAQMPLGRPGFPDEIAKAVLFFASDLGSYVSGV